MFKNIFLNVVNNSVWLFAPISHLFHILNVRRITVTNKIIINYLSCYIHSLSFLDLVKHQVPMRHIFVYVSMSVDKFFTGLKLHTLIGLYMTCDCRIHLHLVRINIWQYGQLISTFS